MVLQSFLKSMRLRSPILCSHEVVSNKNFRSITPQKDCILNLVMIVMLSLRTNHFNFGFLLGVPCHDTCALQASAVSSHIPHCEYHCMRVV